MTTSRPRGIAPLSLCWGSMRPGPVDLLAERAFSPPGVGLPSGCRPRGIGAVPAVKSSTIQSLWPGLLSAAAPKGEPSKGPSQEPPLCVGVRGVHKGQLASLGSPENGFPVAEGVEAGAAVVGPHAAGADTAEGQARDSELDGIVVD